MVAIMMRLRWIAVSLVTIVALAGCSSAHDDEVEQTAEAFHAALKADDGASACDELGDEVQSELQQSSGSSCEVAIMQAGISPDGRVEQVSVSGTAAQVRYDDDVVFLAEFPDGWKVIAAGCQSQPDKPYDCQVQGG
jgi:hypothetical protein